MPPNQRRSNGAPFQDCRLTSKGVAALVEIEGKGPALPAASGIGLEAKARTRPPPCASADLFVSASFDRHGRLNIAPGWQSLDGRVGKGQ